MDKLILDQLNGCGIPNSTLIMVILAGGLILAFVLLFLLKQAESLMFIAISIVIIIALLDTADVNLKSNASYTTEKQTINVTLLPNQTFDTNTCTFISNSKELKAVKYDGTKYIEDSKGKPYIVVDKVKYKVKFSFLSRQSAEHPHFSKWGMNDDMRSIVT